MSTLAIIPARGGSKRLPRKNIIDFHGCPIIAYTIKAALDSRCFDRVVVSTDDMEIAEISARYHSDVVMRPAHLATDESRVVDVCQDFLNAELKLCRRYDVLTVLYATAPLRTAKDIQDVLSLVVDGKHQSAMAVTTYRLPIHQALRLTGLGVEKVFPDLFYKRADEVPEFCVDNGSTYAVKTDYFLCNKQLVSPDVAIHLMPQERSVDIDTQEDYLMAEYYAGLARIKK